MTTTKRNQVQSRLQLDSIQSRCGLVPKSNCSTGVSQSRDHEHWTISDKSRILGSPITPYVLYSGPQAMLLSQLEQEVGRQITLWLSQLTIGEEDSNPHLPGSKRDYRNITCTCTCTCRHVCTYMGIYTKISAFECWYFY